MQIALFSIDGLLFILRWMHFLFGVTWIGLLYYFNFVQGSFFAETDAATKSGAIQKLVPRALWWCLIMGCNVWFIIWPNQKIVIQSATQAASGGQALPNAAACGAKAGLASRTNTLFSIPMLFFMGAASHLPIAIGANANFMVLAIVMAVLIGLIELNAIKGKTGPMTTVKGVIHCGVALTIVMYAVVEVLTK
jgi:uncharacterized membrane protein